MEMSKLELKSFCPRNTKLSLATSSIKKVIALMGPGVNSFIANTEILG